MLLEFVLLDFVLLEFICPANSFTALVASQVRTNDEESRGACVYDEYLNMSLWQGTFETSPGTEDDTERHNVWLGTVHNFRMH